jgi:outer membrane receptor protein involved in Fe transport
MKRNTIILTYMVFMLLPFMGNIYAQQTNPYTISGIVIDSRSYEVLFYANVGLLNADDSTSVMGVSTDENGKFELTNVKAGDYLFQVSYVGYDMIRTPFSIAGDERLIAMDTIRLQPQFTALQGVTVYDKKPVYTIEGEKTLYNVSEDPSIQTGTASDALQNAPGVEVDVEGNITLRGVSSVEIWINDRPSELNAENLKTYIQQLPANSLDRIEVITNPSARYSATGTGGIINIITKSNIKENSFISFGTNVSSRPSVSPWISYVYANKKFSINVYMYAYYSINKSNADGYNISFNDNMDTSNYKNYTSKNESSSLSLGMYINGRYNFDTMNVLNFWVNVNGNPYSKSYSFENYFHQEFLSDIGSYNYTIESTSMSSYGQGNTGLWYQHKFNNEGHKLAAALSASYNGSNSSSKYNRLYQMQTHKDINNKTSMLPETYSLGMMVNYDVPYSKTGIISTGLNTAHFFSSPVWRTDTLLANTSDTYELDSMRYRNIDSKTSMIDGYITFEQKIKKFTIKGGFRIQYRTDHSNYINAPEHNVDKDYTGLFPSLHLSYATDKMHNFGLSYTRRMDIIDPSQASTFITYSEDSYYTGNSDLRVTYTNNIEARWTKYFTKFGSVGLSAYFRNSKDEINDLNDVAYSDYHGRYVTFSMPVNSGKSHAYGIDANITYKLKAFMNIRLYANVYNSRSETAFRKDTKEITDNKFAHSFRLNFWAKLWKVLEVNLSGNYRSKTNSLFQTTEPVYSINGGLRAEFWKRKISVYLNVQDIFNWNRSTNNITNPYYIAYNSTVYNSRYISVGITFRFGKIEMEQQAKTGEQIEQ